MEYREPTWEPPPHRFDLPNAQVQVWQTDLGQVRKEPWCSLRLLSEDEQARAERFTFPIHRERFVACRGLLRVLLGHYLGCDPGLIRFNYGSCGKPELMCPVSDIYFNVSHCNDLALYAFARSHPVGIDVEALRPLENVETLLQLICSSKELIYFADLDLKNQTEAFFRTWVAKEALLKATGEGIGGLAKVELSADGGLSNTIESQATARHLYQFYPRPFYFAALVVEGEVRNLHYWRWG